MWLRNMDTKLTFVPKINFHNFESHPPKFFLSSAIHTKIFICHLFYTIDFDSSHLEAVYEFGVLLHREYRFLTLSQNKSSINPFTHPWYIHDLLWQQLSIISHYIYHIFYLFEIYIYYRNDFFSRLSHSLRKICGLCGYLIL